MNFRHRFVQYATLGLLALIWGSSFILMKRGLVYFDSTEVAAYRMSIAMIVLLPIALRNLSVLRENAWPLFFVGLFGNTVPAFLFVETFRPFLPYGLGFAAGAMVYMVFLELLPEAYENASKPAVGLLVSLTLGAMILFQRYL